MVAILKAILSIAGLVVFGCASGEPVARSGAIAASRTPRTGSPTAIDEVSTRGSPEGAATDDAKRAAARRIVERARAAFQEGRPEDTAELLERAIALDGGFAESYVLLAELHLTQGGNEIALAFLDRAQQLAADSPALLAEIESLRGTVLEELGRREAARDAYERALSMAPDNVRARLGLARVRDSETPGD